MNPGKTTRRLAACALVAGALAASPSSAFKMMYNTSSTQALWVDCNYPNGFAHWPSTQGTLYWYHNTTGAGAGKATVIQNALSTWTNAAESDHVLAYGGTTSAGFNLNDNQNTMVWGDVTSSSLCGTVACHAVTVVRYNAQQVLLEADIVFNQQMDWRTDGTYDSTCTSATNPDGSPKLNVAIDTQAIVTHELGHSLGLGHTSDTTATMGASSCVPNGRTLEADDRAGLQCSTNRFPLAPSYEGFLDGYAGLGCAQISGWAWNANRPNDPVYVNIVDGSTFKAVVLANQSRADLVSAGKGNGVHGWLSTAPSAVKDGQWHTYHAQFSGTGGELVGSPKQLICGVQLFPFTMEPADPPLSTGGVPYEVGTQFESSQAGYITDIGYFFQPGEGDAGSHTVRLWSDTGTLLASAPINPPVIFGKTGWSYAQIPRTAIQANVRYRVSVNTIAYQAKSSCGSANSLQTPYVSGPLKAWQGLWQQGSGVFPNTGSCSNFFVSPRFDM